MENCNVLSTLPRRLQKYDTQFGLIVLVVSLFWLPILSRDRSQEGYFARKKGRGAAGLAPIRGGLGDWKSCLPADLFLEELKSIPRITKEQMAELIDFILHINHHLDSITRDFGVWTYAILFLIVFCETGLVVTPFLPGDSLLFAAGAICARGELNAHVMVVLLIIAAVVGDGVNYAIGHFLGPKVLEKPNRFIKREYILRTQRFYEKYGGKAVVFARFAPIVRTFAPFLAGVGSMNYGRFLMFNIIGGIAWVTLFVYGGLIFGEVPVVKRNFTLVILGIIVVSVLPAFFEVVRARREKRSGIAQAAGGQP